LLFFQWWLIPLLILGDVNAILTTPDWNLSVAHTAHLGAIGFGLMAGILHKYIRSKEDLSQTLSWVSHPEEKTEALTSV
jgi:membrane associated rhomboid family serine protease